MCGKNPWFGCAWMLSPRHASRLGIVSSLAHGHFRRSCLLLTCCCCCGIMHGRLLQQLTPDTKHTTQKKLAGRDVISCHISVNLRRDFFYRVTPAGSYTTSPTEGRAHFVVHEPVDGDCKLSETSVAPVIVAVAVAVALKAVPSPQHPSGADEMPSSSQARENMARMHRSFSVPYGTSHRHWRGVLRVPTAV
ncbi:unnamed protein product, partial [Ectocarpus fasciculatus]